MSPRVRWVLSQFAAVACALAAILRLWDQDVLSRSATVALLLLLLLVFILISARIFRETTPPPIQLESASGPASDDGTETTRRFADEIQRLRSQAEQQRRETGSGAA